MSKSPAENNSSLDKTSALERLPVKNFSALPTKSNALRPLVIPSEKEEEFDPSSVSPQLAMIKKLSAKPKNSLDGEEDKNDPTSPLALCNDGQTSESQSSGPTDQDSVSFQEKLVSDGGVDAKSTGKKNNKNNKSGYGNNAKGQNEVFVKPRPIWVARLPRPTSEKYDDQKAQRERDQVLNEKIKGLTLEIDAKVKESQELKVELDAKRVELKKSREEVKVANDLVKPIRDRWDGLRDAEKSLKEKSQMMKGLDSLAKLEAKLDDLEIKMENESLSVLEQNKILREQKKLRKMQTEVELLEEKKRQTTGPNLVGESRDELKARLNACSEAIDVLKTRLKTIANSHDETFEQMKIVSETITSLKEKRSKFMKERSSKYNELASVRKEIQAFAKFKSLTRDVQASINSKDIDLVSEARMKCEDHNDKLIAQMIESETYSEWYMVENKREQSAARERKMEAQAVKDAERLAKIEEKLKKSNAKREKKRQEEEEEEEEEEEVVPAAIPNAEKPASSSSPTENVVATKKKRNEKQKKNGVKKSPSAAPSTVDGVHKSEEKEKVPKIAEVPEHILEILSTKGDINDNANDASLSPRSQAREKSLEGAQLKARKQQLKQERLKASVQKAEKNSKSMKTINEDLAAASAATQAAKLQMELELKCKKLEEQQRLLSASKEVQIDKKVVKVAAKAAKRAALMKEMKKVRRHKVKKILLAFFLCIAVALLMYSHVTTKPEPKVINLNSWHQQHQEQQRQPEVQYQFEEEEADGEQLFNSEL